ncbi:ATP-dependent DNA helicase RecQ [Mytilus galloprovincialis]|uniref:DNA 3'-5' helicase n=1 Tax=Mytilus galloprovincialis TaxID=29158 RepID=A0A8B6G267_MYTGA|nr:ATP-dependent DNA helicase RecQ [Mytilus galloprovincialis]
MDDKIKEVCLEIYPDLSMKGEQVAGIAAILNNKDVVVNLPVGFGKSVIFHALPGVLNLYKKPNKVLVILPLTSIIKEQKEKLDKIGVKAVALSQKCTLLTEEEADVSDAVLKSSVILAHPEAVLNAEKGVEILTSLDGKIGAIVVDECHKIDDWAPFACLSGTLTKHHIKSLSKCLHLADVEYISVNPDKPNLLLHCLRKEKGDSLTVIENIFKEQVDNLYKCREEFSVTLMFMPLQYISHAMSYAYFVFGGREIVNLNNALFGCLYSNQDEEVMSCILSDLQTICPRFRLIFTTSVVGMGFDPPSVTHVIHCKPPRNLTNYLQEIGRAGRRGQSAKATLHFSNSDISRNLPGIQDDIINYCHSNLCLRECLLNIFSFSKSMNSPHGCSCCNICEKDCSDDDCLLVNTVVELHV